MRSLGIVLAGAALSFFAAVPAFAAGGGLSAVDDSVVAEKKVIHIDVLANDSAGGAKIDTATLRIASAPSSGEAVVIASGSPKVKYTSAGAEAQVDTFTYAICDGDGVCARATVTVNFLGEIVTTTTTISSTTTSPPPTDTLPTVPAPATTVPVAPATTVAVEPAAATTIAQTNPTSPATTLPLALMPTTTTAPAANVHALAELALGSDEPRAVGTTLGEARGVKLDEDVAYLGRSGLDTLALVATPALMVSGFVGFLMIGLPQNAFGVLFGALAGRRRKKEPEGQRGPGSPSRTVDLRS